MGLSRSAWYKPLVDWLERDRQLGRDAQCAGRQEAGAGLLEAIPATAAPGVPLEPQTCLASILPAAAQPASPYEEVVSGCLTYLHYV